MRQEERWKQELEQYKLDLEYLYQALGYVQKEESNTVLRRLLFGGMMQGFGAALRRSGCVMNEYMRALGQSRNKSLKNIFTKALKMGLISHKRWLDAEGELEMMYEVENIQEYLKMEKKIRRIYLPLLKRFESEMDAKSQPTLFG